MNGNQETGLGPFLGQQTAFGYQPEQGLDIPPDVQRAQPVPGQVYRAQPAQPVQSPPPAPTTPSNSIFIKDGRVTNFAGPRDLAIFKKLKAEGQSDEYAFKYGDNGIGAKDLGTINTPNAYGVAVPQDQLRALLGPDPAAYRTARVRMTINNLTVNVPIVDYGPDKEAQMKGAVLDATYPLSQAFGGVNYNWEGKGTNLGIIKNAGPDYMTNRDAWKKEQDDIHALLNYGTYGEPAPTPSLK
jgi:hypothetical protein